MESRPKFRGGEDVSEWPEQPIVRFSMKTRATRAPRRESRLPSGYVCAVDLNFCLVPFELEGEKCNPMHAPSTEFHHFVLRTTGTS